LDSLKALQLPLDNTAGRLFPDNYDTKSPNNVIKTIIFISFSRKPLEKSSNFRFGLNGPLKSSNCGV